MGEPLLISKIMRVDPKKQFCLDPAQRPQVQICQVSIDTLFSRVSPLCCGAVMMEKFRGEDTAELVNKGFNLASCQHF